jgi:F0F1-type ATP synthase beta subunit
VSGVLPARVSGTVAAVVGHEVTLRGLRLGVGDSVVIAARGGQVPAEVVAVGGDGASRSRAAASPTRCPVGVRVVDTLCTTGRGQRVGIFAGSGVGKSTLLGMMVRGTTADVNV